MLNFDNNHKVADMANVKNKLDKAKNVGKVLVAGVFIGGCIMFGNYIGDQAFPNNDKGDVPVNYSAVVEKDDQGMVVDLNYYTYRLSGKPFVKSHEYTLVTPDGDRLATNEDSVKFFDGEDAHEKAVDYANSTYSKVTYYNNQSQGLSKI